MLRTLAILAVSLARARPEAAASLEDDSRDTMDFLYEGEARTFYFNASNTATSVTILGILLLLGLITYLIYYQLALTPLSNAGFNRPQLNTFNSGR
jgi:hypothetical protein